MSTTTRASHEVDPELNPDVASAPVGPDLLRRPIVRRLMKSRAYPAVLQIPVAAVFGLVAYELLAGPLQAHENAGSALLWVLWWPLVPISFVVLGRIWCAVCPFGVLSDVVQKLVGLHRPVPRFLRRYGIWIIDAAFLLITWADHVWGVVESPWGSGLLLLLLTTGVIACGALYQRRAFCRYLCFLGGLAGNYARAGALQLRADTSICDTCDARAACYNGTATAPGCPLFSFPRTMDDAANCNLCANCIKNCPNDAITLRVTSPTAGLWSGGTPKIEGAVLAMAIMGVVLVQNLTMVSIWNPLLARLSRLTGLANYSVLFTLLFATAVGLPVVALRVAAGWASRLNLESTMANMARFGYALIPLDVAAHIGHNLFHLLGEGRSLYYAVAGLWGQTHGDAAMAVAPTPTIRALQYVLLAAGLVGSVYTARRIARRRYRAAARWAAAARPYVVLIVGFAALNAWLFALPMSHRM